MWTQQRSANKPTCALPACLPVSWQDTFSNYWAILLSPLFNLNPLFSQYKCKLVHRQRTVTWSRSCCEGDDAATAKWRTLPAKTTVENDDGNMNEHRIFSGTQYLATTLVESLWESIPPHHHTAPLGTCIIWKGWLLLFLLFFMIDIIEKIPCMKLNMVNLTKPNHGIPSASPKGSLLQTYIPIRIVCSSWKLFIKNKQMSLEILGPRLPYTFFWG